MASQPQPKMSTLQESKNHLAPITVKLGNYSKWNRSRDFNRAVKLPVDRGGFLVLKFLNLKRVGVSENIFKAQELNVVCSGQCLTRVFKGWIIVSMIVDKGCTAI